MMPGASPRGRKAAQPGSGIKIAIALLCGWVGVRSKKQVAVFRHKQEEQSVDEAQHLPVKVLLVNLPGPQTLLERGVRRMGEETLAKMFDRLLHTVAETVKKTHALGSRGLRPGFQLAEVRTRSFQARLVEQQPKEDEVRICLARHHRFEVKFDVCLTGQAYVVTQEAQAETI